MTLRLDLVGVPTEPLRRSWTDRDTLLYAIAVGAGSDDPTRELEFTTENSAGVTQKVIPTFGSIVANARSPRTLGDFDAAKLLHGEQAVTFHAPLQTSGEVVAVSTLTDVYDKDKSAVLVQQNVATDAATGERLLTSTSTFIVFGEGGFGGDRGPQTPQWGAPEREPDTVVTLATRRDQALLYRLTGDRNPLHSDPSVAARAGYPRPILHGMCTYGFTCRGLISGAAGGDPAALASMSARFSRPAMPGDTLQVQIWADGADIAFRTLNGRGDVLLDRGVATLR